MFAGKFTIKQGNDLNFSQLGFLFPATVCLTTIFAHYPLAKKTYEKMFVLSR